MKTKRFADDGAIARRALLRRVGGTLAGAVVAGGTSTAEQNGRHPLHEHNKPRPSFASQEAAAVAASAAPRALDAHERATLSALGDRLVPGSARADVADLIDRLMGVESPEDLRRFRNALGAFEREARLRYAKTWLELAEAEQAEILTRASTMPPSVIPPSPWRPGQPAVGSSASASPKPATLRDHHDHLRRVVARVYFATEAGMTELGWTGLEFWDALPRCRPE